MSAEEKLDQASRFVTQHVAEVKNGIGGVIGYQLSLTMAETEALWKILEPESMAARRAEALARGGSMIDSITT